MIWLSTVEIVEAVQRCLSEHVGPQCRDEYATVQLSAAVLALEEVANRLKVGDPVEDDNQRMRKLAERFQLSVAGDVEPRNVDDQRRLNVELRSALAAALSAGPPARRRQVLGDLVGVEKAIARADVQWICPEAIASLE